MNTYRMIVISNYNGSKEAVMFYETVEDFLEKISSAECEFSVEHVYFSDSLEEMHKWLLGIDK